MRKYTSSVLIPCLLFQFIGCSTTLYLPSDELEELNTRREIVIYLKDKRAIPIRDWYLSKDSLFTVAKLGTTTMTIDTVGFALADIEKITQSSNTAYYLIGGIGVLIASIGVILLISGVEGCGEWKVKD